MKKQRTYLPKNDKIAKGLAEPFDEETQNLLTKKQRTYPPKNNKITY